MFYELFRKFRTVLTFSVNKEYYLYFLRKEKASTVGNNGYSQAMIHFCTISTNETDTYTYLSPM